MYRIPEMRQSAEVELLIPIQSTLRRPEVHTFHRKIGICTAPMGVNNMRAAHVVVKNNTKYKTL